MERLYAVASAVRDVSENMRRGKICGELRADEEKRQLA
jgi:hypothetical protein